MNIILDHKYGKRDSTIHTTIDAGSEPVTASSEPVTTSGCHPHGLKRLVSSSFGLQKNTHDTPQHSCQQCRRLEASGVGVVGLSSASVNIVVGHLFCRREPQ
ncbi:hypothetical protein HN51_032355 [Arachis hypogaea]